MFCLQDALAFLQTQGKVEQALFEPLCSSNKSSAVEEYSDDASSSPQAFPNGSDQGDEEEHSDFEPEGQENTNDQSEDEVDGVPLFDEDESVSDDYESGLPGFEELFGPLRRTNHRSRKQNLFDFMVTHYIIDAIFICLKYSSIPEDTKESLIPKFAANSMYSTANSATSRILLDLLLKHGANIDGVDRRGRTALIKSVQCEDVEMTKLLTSR